MWEDPLIAAFGSDWREVMRCCPTLVAWKRLFEQGLTQLCSSWNLPQAAKANTKRPTRGAGGVGDLACDGSAHDGSASTGGGGDETSGAQWWPLLTLVHEDANLARPLHTFLMVVDNEALARIASGDAVVREGHYKPPFERITQRSDEVMTTGRLPHGPFPCAWRPRHLNKLADEAVNKAMTEKGNFLQNFACPLSLDDFRILCFSDGGLCRSTDSPPRCAGCGWCIIGVHRSGCMYLFEVGGILMALGSSAFEAELVGLDQATARLMMWLRRDRVLQEEEVGRGDVVQLRVEEVEMVREMDWVRIEGSGGKRERGGELDGRGKR